LVAAEIRQPEFLCVMGFEDDSHGFSPFGFWVKRKKPGGSRRACERRDD
jgi:hypothetical protein